MAIQGNENVPVILPDSPEQYSVLDYVTVAAFSFHQLFNQKCVVAVADSEKYRVYLPGRNIDHKLKAGDRLIDGSVMYNAIKSQSRVSVRKDSSLFGFPYIGTAYPVFDSQKQVVGGIIYCENIQLMEDLTNAAENLSALTSQVVKMVESLESSTNNLDNIGSVLKLQSQESMDMIKSTDSLLQLIVGIARQTNVLGINASIEASRAGKLGAGFNVVASEIRNLSDESMQSVKTIGETLKEIRDSAAEVQNKVEGISDAVQQQSGIVQELAAVMQHLHAITEVLNTQAVSILED